MQCIPIDLGRWFDFFSGFKVCAWCERRFELHTIWARMNVYESVQMCIYERVGVPGWPVSRTQQLCYRYPPSTESTPLLVNQLIWSELLALYDCLTQLWRVAILTMLASTGLTVKQRVTLRRNDRDVEVSSFISPCDLILNSARKRPFQSLFCDHSCTLWQFLAVQWVHKTNVFSLNFFITSNWEILSAIQRFFDHAL